MVRRRVPERPFRRRFGPEFAVRTQFGNVEIDLKDPAFREHQVEPQRQGQFQRLANVAAALPEEQVLDRLLGDGGAAADVVEAVGVFVGVVVFGFFFVFLCVFSVVVFFVCFFFVSE